MSTQNDVKSRTHLSDHGDGLAEIFIGIFLVTFGLGMLSEMNWLGAISTPLLYVAWQRAKTQIVLPRLGQDARQQAIERGGKSFGKMTTLFTVSLFLGLFFLVVFASGNLEAGILAWLRSNFHLVVGILLGVFLASFGAILRAGRFNSYALLAVAITLAGAYFDVPLWVTINGIGSLTFLAGLLTLRMFLRRYPMDEDL